MKNYVVKYVSLKDEHKTARTWKTFTKQTEAVKEANDFINRTTDFDYGGHTLDKVWIDIYTVKKSGKIILLHPLKI